MTDKPIIFSPPMVRALRAGTKTQTRRLVDVVTETTFDSIPSETLESWELDNRLWPTADGRSVVLGRPLRWRVGDRLWVKEAHAFPNDQVTIYRADWREDAIARGMDNIPADDAGIKWRPSIHMFRRDSRLTLTVTNVRVERLQDISEEDARAEGITPAEFVDYAACRRGYRALWNSLHGPDAWAANPWVAADSFTVEQRNIDDARVAA